MSDYKITIRCEHVARTQDGGRVASARVATAHWRVSTDGVDPDTGDVTQVDPYEEWAYSASRAGRITEPPMRLLPPEQRALRNATQMQIPRAGGPSEWRVAIECLGCHQRVVALQRNLDALLDRVRHAGIHTLDLSYIRANL